MVDEGSKGELLLSIVGHWHGLAKGRHRSVVHIMMVPATSQNQSIQERHCDAHIHPLLHSSRGPLGSIELSGNSALCTSPSANDEFSGICRAVLGFRVMGQQKNVRASECSSESPSSSISSFHKSAASLAYDGLAAAQSRLRLARTIIQSIELYLLPRMMIIREFQA